jgi:large subunit ribosomal protein L21
MLGFRKPAQVGQSMYAVVKTGGKQYRVSAGEKVKVEQIAADVGAEIALDQVLLVADGEAVRLGAPLVDGVSVTAKVLAHGRGDKIEIFKMRRRKHYRKSQGHRQNYPEIEILGIAG